MGASAAAVPALPPTIAVLGGGKSSLPCDNKGNVEIWGWQSSSEAKIKEVRCTPWGGAEAA